jgi:hypothetical protein
MENVELVSASGGTLSVTHGGHAGTCPTKFPKLPGGASDTSAVILTCPVCGATSLWPVTGGADPGMADELAAVADAASSEEAKPKKPKKG